MEPSALIDASTAILRGERSPEPRFGALIDAFAEEFGIEVVNVTSDGTVVRGSRGRLNLWCRTTADRRAFNDDTSNYDPVKQARASELVQDGPWFVHATDYSRERLVQFIGAGLRTVGASVPGLLGDDRIHRVDGAFGRLVVFARSRAEADELRQGTIAKEWEDLLWAAFADRTSADFVPRERFRLEVDSQEAYDVDYQGSGYYYWL